MRHHNQLPENDPLKQEIDKYTAIFLKDNFTNPTEHDRLIINSAMMVGVLCYMRWEIGYARSEEFAERYNIKI